MPVFFCRLGPAYVGVKRLRVGVAIYCDYTIVLFEPNPQSSILLLGKHFPSLLLYYKL